MIGSEKNFYFAENPFQCLVGAEALPSHPHRCFLGVKNFSGTIQSQFVGLSPFLVHVPVESAKRFSSGLAVLLKSSAFFKKVEVGASSFVA